MALVSQTVYGTATITCTLTSLGSATWRQSAEVDNSTNKYVEVLVGGQVQAGALSADGTLEVYAYGTWDGASYTGGVGSTDQAITWGTTGATSVYGYLQLPLLRVASIASTDDNEIIHWGPTTVSPCFGGVMPTKWGLVFRNNTNTALGTTASAITYQGIKFEVA